MEITQTREAVLVNEVLTPEDQERIQKFITPYASKLKIDWKKNNTLSIRTKHKKDGCNILITYKDREVKNIDVSQMNLFIPDEGLSSKEVSENGKLTDKEE